MGPLEAPLKVRVGMLPLILTVLNRDYDRGVLQSLLRTVSIRRIIPRRRA